ncbi:leucine zipper domain-containing protein [Anaeromyxobacter dehalogenans]|uniref:leucine zipper domain-containing protein n=1 Tax=Anaeromyxobacter dehalogenans TaxID=161493 RepID=UPI0009D65A02
MFIRPLPWLSAAARHTPTPRRSEPDERSLFCPNHSGGRALLVTQEHWSVARAAEAAGMSPRTVYKWLRRFEVEGAEGLLDRSSRPKRSPTAISPGWQQLVLELRRSRMTGAAIATRLKTRCRAGRTAARA